MEPRSSDLDLHNKEMSEKYYDVKYARKGGLLSAEYMAEWQEEKKKRLFNIIRQLQLPPQGTALDFGCGSGVLTEVIREALPDYQVYGTDLSHTALDKAREHYPHCVFFHTSDSNYNKKKFDFLFTHHVLEHVYDLQKVAGEIDQYLKKKSTMLHILPCGNEGSFEHGLCLLRKNGFNAQKDGAFFFEDEGHVRRLKTVDLNKIFSQYNYKLVDDFYSEHYFGAIKWITESNPLLVLKMVNPLCGKDFQAKIRLMQLGFLLVGLNLLRLPITLISKFKLGQRRDLVGRLLYALCLAAYPLAYPLDRQIRKDAAEEWRRRQKEKTGSEMYLVYARDADGS